MLSTSTVYLILRFVESDKGKEFSGVRESGDLKARKEVPKNHLNKHSA